jgi:hypothetical protein
MDGGATDERGTFVDKHEPGIRPQLILDEDDR